MKANTAVLFILLGGGIFCASSDGAAVRARRLLGLAVALVAGLTLVQDLFALNFGIDEILFRDPASSAYPGRMAPATALDFLLLGLALWLEGEGLRFRASQAAVLLAAQRARVNLATLNEALASEGRQQIDFGIGLHTGAVAFGNIGAGTRLDFTVIGPAVNQASRIQDLTKELKEPILASGDFAAILEAPMRRVAVRPLRGVEKPVELFAPA